MKTVMKKMFCLLLVAVLLVGAIPTAFADESTVTCEHTAGPEATCTTAQTCTICGETLVAALGHTAGPEATCTTAQTCTTCGETLVAALGHTAGPEATCTTAQTCTVCGTELASVDANAHSYDAGTITTPATCSTTGIKTYTCANNASHTYTEEVAIDPNAHSFSDKGVCTLCNLCKHCGMTNAHMTNCIYYCNGTTNCPNDPTVSDAHNEGCLKTKCNKNGCTKDYGHTGACSVPCTKTAGCVLNQGHDGSCDTPCTFSGCTKGYKHTGDHSNACAICKLPLMKSPEHKANCSYYYVNAKPESVPGNSDLEIWVNLHTANVETKTRLLVTYENLSSNTLIYEFIADRRDDIDDMLVNYYGKDYEWSGHVYDSAKANKAVKTTAKLGEGAAVYINAYTYQDLVYVYVHNDRSYNNIRVILFEGKQIGDTISRAEVVDAVNDYYNLSSLKMYSEDDWKKVVAGKSVDARDNLKVTEEPFHIDVLISGTSAVGSGYTADSTNPKTGDMIMTPAIIMCASIGALATLFYLNKKRAI